MRHELNRIIKGFTSVQDFLTYVEQNKTEICGKMALKRPVKLNRNRESNKVVR